MADRDEARAVVERWMRLNKGKTGRANLRHLEQMVENLLGQRHRASFKEGANAGKEHLLASMDLDGVDEV